MMEKPQALPLSGVWPRRGLTPAFAFPRALGSDGKPRPLGVAGERVQRQDPLESGHAARAELSAGGRPQLLERLGRGPRSPVDPRREHRVEGIRDMDDPSAKWDL